MNNTSCRYTIAPAQMLIRCVLLCLLGLPSVAVAQWRSATNTTITTTSPFADIMREGKVIVGKPVSLGLPTSVATEARIEAFNGALAQLQAGTFGTYFTNNTWAGLGQAGTISSPIASAYGLAMIKTDRLGFFNLVDFNRNSPTVNTKDLVVGFGTNDAVKDLNQRFLIRYFTGQNVGSNIAPVASNTILSANPNGSVGINTENPSSTFFVDATNAATTSSFRNIFLLNSGTTSNFTAATFSAMGQEGNSTVNAPIHGFRTQVGSRVALNMQVNASNAARQEAEVTWQDLDFTAPSVNANENQDRLTFYFRNGSNNPSDRRRAMTLLANSTAGVDVENPTVVGQNGSSILFFPQRRPMRFDVPSAPMRSQSYYRLETDELKVDVQDIPEALGRILRLEGRTYLWRGYYGDQKTPTYGFNQQSVFDYLPDAHIKHDDGQISIDYDAILAATVEAIKEMNGIFSRTNTSVTTSQAQTTELLARQEKVIKQQQLVIDELVSKVNSMAQKMGEAPLTAKAKETVVSPELSQPAPIATPRILSANPNPSDGNTKIVYDINTDKAVSIVIADQSGRVISTYNNLAKGKNVLAINKGELAAGIYNYSLLVNGVVTATDRMVIAK